MTYLEFKAKWLGEKIDFDHAYGYQCVDLAREYVQDVWSLPTFPFFHNGLLKDGGARDAFLDFGNSLVRSNEIEKRVNDHSNPNQIPMQGDLIILDGTIFNPYGHIGIVDSAKSGDKVFYMLEQNGGLGTGLGMFTDEIRVRSISWSSGRVLGWLRNVKQNPEVISQPIDNTPQEQKVQVETEVSTIPVNVLIASADPINSGQVEKIQEIPAPAVIEHPMKVIGNTGNSQNPGRLNTLSGIAQFLNLPVNKDSYDEILAWNPQLQELFPNSNIVNYDSIPSNTDIRVPQDFNVPTSQIPEELKPQAPVESTTKTWTVRSGIDSLSSIYVNSYPGHHYLDSKWSAFLHFIQTHDAPSLFNERRPDYIQGGWVLTIPENIDNI